jgi:hypothetical protein
MTLGYSIVSNKVGARTNFIVFSIFAPQMNYSPNYWSITIQRTKQFICIIEDVKLLTFFQSTLSILRDCNKLAEDFEHGL